MCVLFNGWLCTFLILFLLALNLAAFFHILRLRSRVKSASREFDEFRRVGSEFVANISHELKTPLTSIKGYTETLRNSLIRDPAKAPNFISKIEDNAERLGHLINDILELSRIESPNVHLEKSQISLETFFQELRKQFSDKLQERKQILFIVNEVSSLFADPKLLDQALSNLIENAHRYSPEGAIIELDCRVVAEGGQSFVRFSVRDNGPGISSTDLPRIFERFYRADKSRNRLSGGTGLGLAIVKHIVQSHEGSVRVSSQLGSGTEFQLLFPA